MKRFTGQPLRAKPHVAVLYTDQPGGFVVATPLLRGLKEKYPGCVVDYFSGPRTAELEAACPYIDSRYDLFGEPSRNAGLSCVAAYRDARIAAAGPYDLAINLDRHAVNTAATAILQPCYVVGRCFTPDGRQELPIGPEKVDKLLDEFWSAPDFHERYRDVLETTFIAEIFCRMARIETDFQRTEVPMAQPPLSIPDILIVTGARRPAKLWPTDYWQRFILRCADEGLSVGLLGAPAKTQRAVYGAGDMDHVLLSTTSLVDLRGKFTLPEVAGALARARACVTIDTGIMHMAYSVGVPTLALFGASPVDVWAPRRPNLHVIWQTAGCAMCRDNRFKNDDCLRPDHVCMESITPEAVCARLMEVLRPVASIGGQP